MFEVIALYLGVGVIGGILAGLLGIGGGLVIVPMLVICFELLHLPQELIMHMALGTSMASIIFTSISSSRAHHKRGAVDWGIVRRIVAGILIGSFLGSYVASSLSTGVLKVVFVIFLYYVCYQMLTGKKPKASRQLPSTPGMFGAGGAIGIFSSLVGIGGGTLSVPFMVWHNVPIHRAIGTSAAIGFPIAVAATIGYVINGWGQANLPPLSLGYVSLSALVCISVMTVSTAPIGVKLAHSLPVDRLKKGFALLLFLVATKMLISVL